MFFKYYLAYGSNLNSQVINSFCKKHEKVGSMYLNGYGLAFRGTADGSSFLTIEEDPEKSVPVGIYKIGFFDMFELDKYEGYPELYRRESININVGDKVVKAFVYVMNDGYEEHLPSVEYFGLCLRGYKEFNFDTEILYQALSKREKVKK